MKIIDRMLMILVRFISAIALEIFCEKKTVIRKRRKI